EVGGDQAVPPESREAHSIPVMAWIDLVTHRQIEAERGDPDGVLVDVDAEEVALQEPFQKGGARGLTRVRSAPAVNEPLERFHQENPRPASRIQDTEVPFVVVPRQNAVEDEVDEVAAGIVHARLLANELLVDAADELQWNRVERVERPEVELLG